MKGELKNCPNCRQIKCECPKQIGGEMNQIQTYTEKIKREVEAEYGMGGLSDGLYGDYASEVAKRSLIQTYQELIEWAKKERWADEPKRNIVRRSHIEVHNNTLNSLISYLKGRIEEVKKSETKELK